MSSKLVGPVQTLHFYFVALNSFKHVISSQKLLIVDSDIEFVPLQNGILISGALKSMIYISLMSAFIEEFDVCIGVRHDN